MNDIFTQPTTDRFVMRPYQAEAVSRSVDFLKHPKDHNGIVILPTGSGKSIVIANVVKELNAPTIIFQPGKEILEQNVEKYRSYGYRCGVYSASAGQKVMGDVTFAMIGSVITKLDRLSRFKYILVDECQRVNPKGGQYEELITKLGVRVLGLTATPYRLGTHTDMKSGTSQAILKFLTRTRPRIFDKVVHYVQNRELFEAGYLSKLTYHQVNTIDRQNLRVNSTGADYTDDSLRAAYQMSGFESKVVKVVNRIFELGRPNALVFTRFTKEAEYVVRNVPGAAIVTAETKPKERDRVISGFRQGRIRCVCNVGILTTGFDYPELQSVVLARPTRSLELYYQMIGRCMRPHASKQDSLVIDMCGNYEQFGPIEDLELSDSGTGWHVSSNGKELTGVPFGDRHYFKKRA